MAIHARSVSDHTPSHPSNVETEHVDFIDQADVAGMF